MSADLGAWRLWLAMSAPVVLLFAMASAVRATPEGAHARDEAHHGAFAFAVAGAAVVALQSSLLEAAGVLALLAGLAYLAVFDLRTLSVPVAPIAVLIGLGIAVGFVSGWSEFASRGGAALAGAATFSVLAWVYQLVRGRSGLGAGDAWIAALLGAWLSFEGLAWSVALGGAVLLAWQGGRRRAPDRAAPFAPGLAIGALVYSLISAWG